MIVRHYDIHLAVHRTFENPVVGRIGFHHVQHNSAGSNGMRDLGDNPNPSLKPIFLPREIVSQNPGHLPDNGGETRRRYFPSRAAIHKTAFRPFGCVNAEM
jgi:hypothetical protein